MSEEKARNRTFVLIAFVISIFALAAWFAWNVAQPACGPPGTSGLAHLDRWAPGILIAADLAATSVAGVLLKRALLLIAVTLATVCGIAILCGAVISFLIAAHGGCFS